MAVADEKKVEKQNKQKLKSSKRKFKVWLFGIAISLLPLMALPFWDLISGGNLETMFYKLFCDISIMFVGISFTITAMNDFMYKEQDDWMLNLILLILGAIVYTIVIIQKDANSNMNMDVVFGLNLGYFILMFVLSASKYIKEIWEVK